jgi:hypothetical protein
VLHPTAQLVLHYYAVPEISLSVMKRLGLLLHHSSSVDLWGPFVKVASIGSLAQLLICQGFPGPGYRPIQPTEAKYEPGLLDPYAALPSYIRCFLPGSSPIARPV